MRMRHQLTRVTVVTCMETMTYQTAIMMIRRAKTTEIQIILHPHASIKQVGHLCIQAAKVVHVADKMFTLCHVTIMMMGHAITVRIQCVPRLHMDTQQVGHRHERTTTIRHTARETHLQRVVQGSR